MSAQLMALEAKGYTTEDIFQPSTDDAADAARR